MGVYKGSIYACRPIEFYAFDRERDELMEHITSLHHKVELLKQREEDAYQQVKKSVELVEQAQMEQTQVQNLQHS